MRDVGTIVRGIRTPIIKEGDDLANIVVDSVLKAAKSEKFELEDRDVIAITEAVVGISEGNFATLDQIAKDIKNKLKNSNHIGTWTDLGYNWNGFNPLGVKDDGTDNKGYHAEYEFEVFNHSNGVTDQITQRGFIRWIQFGITKTGNVSSTLSDCKILGNFYGGGNLATVDGNVTSTLTNTQVDGSVFGAGYSAAIPTFQVHDKSTVSFPSITAGVITDGYIGYDSKCYMCLSII